MLAVYLIFWTPAFFYFILCYVTHFFIAKRELFQSYAFDHFDLCHRVVVNFFEKIRKSKRWIFAVIHIHTHISGKPHNKERRGRIIKFWFRITSNEILSSCFCSVSQSLGLRRLIWYYENWYVLCEERRMTRKRVKVSTSQHSVIKFYMMENLTLNNLRSSPLRRVMRKWLERPWKALWSFSLSVSFHTVNIVRITWSFSCSVYAFYTI